tara:strand:+ start:126 stop:407 length:282 start_codon:yes stop_codon:yes gene_type:complete
MSRYKNTRVKKDRDGKNYYCPTIIRGIPLSDGDLFVFPVDGDRFDTLAQRYYNDSNLWWIIAKANNMIDGTMGLDPEKRVRVPLDIEKILQSV